MKKEFLRKETDSDRFIQDSAQEDFTELLSVVDNLLKAMEDTQKEKAKLKKKSVSKKLKKPKPQKKTIEDLGIRDLPFTF